VPRLVDCAFRYCRVRLPRLETIPMMNATQIAKLLDDARALSKVAVQTVPYRVQQGQYEMALNDIQAARNVWKKVYDEGRAYAGTLSSDAPDVYWIDNVVQEAYGALQTLDLLEAQVPSALPGPLRTALPGPLRQPVGPIGTP